MCHLKACSVFGPKVNSQFCIITIIFSQCGLAILAVLDFSAILNKIPRFWCFYRFFCTFQVLSVPKSNSAVAPPLTNVILVKGTSGKIQSTNFPMDYPPSTTQTIHIVGPKATRIRLRFEVSSSKIVMFLRNQVYRSASLLWKEGFFAFLYLEYKQNSIFFTVSYKLNLWYGRLFKECAKWREHLRRAYAYIKDTL